MNHVFFFLLFLVLIVSNAVHTDMEKWGKKRKNFTPVQEKKKEQFFKFLTVPLHCSGTPFDAAILPGKKWQRQRQTKGEIVEEDEEGGGVGDGHRLRFPELSLGEKMC